MLSRMTSTGLAEQMAYDLVESGRSPAEPPSGPEDLQRRIERIFRAES